MIRRSTFLTGRPNHWLACLAVGCLGWGVPQQANSEEGLSYKSHYQRIARIVAESLPQAHVHHATLDDPIAEKALNNYLRTLDFDRTFFLAEEVGTFKQRATSLDDELRSGHIEFAYEVFAEFKDRAQERVAYVRNLLETAFDLTLDEDFTFKRKDEPWPQTAEERDDLWRKKIKNEYLGRKVAKALYAESSSDNPGEEDRDDEARDLLEKTPEEMVLKMHQQFLNVLEGHDAEWVLQAYLNAFTTAYDSHSSYLSPRATEDFDIAMKLSLTGIGAVLKYDDGAAKIVRLIAGGPAERDGRLGPGDRITAVAQGEKESEDILYWPLYKSVRLIRGEKGTKVVLHVTPAADPSGTTIKKIDLVRDTINLEERSAKKDVRHFPGDGTGTPVKLGVLTLPDFYADQQGIRKGKENSKSSARDIKKLLQELRDEDIDGVLLDLRNNGGGSLQEAVEMTGFFIARGPIVQVKANRRVQVLKDPDRNVVYEGPLVILVNRMSASASEILAAALQDYERAIIIGDNKTHGKGTVQSVFPIDRRKPHLGSLKITTAGFYRVNGHSTQLKGVKPDILVPSALDVMEIGEEFLPNILDWSQVSQTKFNSYPDLQNEIGLLQEKSHRRLADDQEYALYQELIQRLKSQINKTSTSLNYERRLEIAREDQELTKLQEAIRDRLNPNTSEEDDEEEEKKDFILSEALHILRDFVELRRVEDLDS